MFYSAVVRRARGEAEELSNKDTHLQISGNIEMQIQKSPGLRLVYSPKTACKVGKLK